MRIIVWAAGPGACTVQGHGHQKSLYGNASAVKTQRSAKGRGARADGDMWLGNWGGRAANDCRPGNVMNAAGFVAAGGAGLHPAAPTRPPAGVKQNAAAAAPPARPRRLQPRCAQARSAAAPLQASFPLYTQCWASVHAGMCGRVSAAGTRVWSGLYQRGLSRDASRSRGGKLSRGRRSSYSLLRGG